MSPGTLSDGADDVEQVVARQTGEIERFGAPGAGRARRREQRAAERFAHEAEHEIAARVEIVNAQNELAEAGLAEVLDDELRVAAAQVLVRRRLQARSALQQIPQTAAEVRDRTASLERRAEHRPRQRAA